MDVVVFNESVTLSQHYVALGEAAKEFGKGYEKSGNETLMQLATAYYTMKEEAKYLSKLVEKQLQQYDWEILQGSAVLRDMLCDACGNGGGGGGDEPSGCNWECVISGVLQDPETLAMCAYVLYACAVAPVPLNPACWLLIGCVLVYGIGCALMCCWW